MVVLPQWLRRRVGAFCPLAQPDCFPGFAADSTAFRHSPHVAQGDWPPFVPSDVRVRTLDGIADDRPFACEDLLPGLEAMERARAAFGPSSPGWNLARRRAKSLQSMY